MAVTISGAGYPSAEYAYNPVTGLWVPVPAKSTGQITNVALGANGVYTQAWQDSQALNVDYLQGSVFSDQPGTLYVDFADDQAHPIQGVMSVAVPANTPVQLPTEFLITTQYFRFRYVNGATAQTTFELYQTLLPGSAPRNVNAQLTGRNVIEYIPFNALAIADTANHSTGIIDLNMCKNVQLIVRNTLNQPVTLTIYPDGSQAASIWNGGTWASSNAVIPVSATALLNTFWTFLNNQPFCGYNKSKLVILAQCTTAPISGNLTLYIEGEPN